MTQAIRTNRYWSVDSVRTACVRNRLYTCGDCEDYEHMLNQVKIMYPDTDNIYFIAQDIAKHSYGQIISNVMYILENQAVTTTFEIEGEDE